eukprot:65600_1
MSNQNNQSNDEIVFVVNISGRLLGKSMMEIWQAICPEDSDFPMNTLDVRLLAELVSGVQNARSLKATRQRLNGLVHRFGMQLEQIQPSKTTVRLENIKHLTIHSDSWQDVVNPNARTRRERRKNQQSERIGHRSIQPPIANRAQLAIGHPSSQPPIANPPQLAIGPPSQPPIANPSQLAIGHPSSQPRIANPSQLATQKNQWKPQTQNRNNGNNNESGWQQNRNNGMNDQGWQQNRNNGMATEQKQWDESGWQQNRNNGMNRDANTQNNQWRPQTQNRNNGNNNESGWQQNRNNGMNDQGWQQNRHNGKRKNVQNKMLFLMN